MQEYIPLFAIAFIAIIFATVQDLRTREVANWLNFSLIAFALAYRAFYAISINNLEFFLFGLLGLGVMIVLGHAFYYMKAFAGGDAKLLMGLGVILPYQTYLHLILLPIFLIFTLFLAGAVYSLVYSIFLISKKKKQFSKEFKKFSKNKKGLLIISTALFVIALGIGFYRNIAFLFAIIFLIPLVWIYTRSLDKCMIILMPPEKLTEGDWLEEEITIGKTKIKKSVHGLSFKEIQFLRKHKKKVLIKQGIPFVPAFLITIILMALFFLTSRQVLPFPFYLIS
ncbi:MAG: A24 family peptidase [archaeon]